MQIITATNKFCYREGAVKFSVLSGNRKRTAIRKKNILLSLRVSEQRYGFMPCRYPHINGTKQSLQSFSVHSVAAASSVTQSGTTLY